MPPACVSKRKAVRASNASGRLTTTSACQGPAMPIGTSVDPVGAVARADRRAGLLAQVRLEIGQANADVGRVDNRAAPSVLERHDHLVGADAARSDRQDDLRALHDVPELEAVRGPDALPRRDLTGRLQAREDADRGKHG